MLLPAIQGLQIERMSILTNQVLFFLETNLASASCPQCQTISHQKHGFYRRTLQDLAWGEYGVRLYLKIKRFVCSNSACPALTFSESRSENLRATVKPHARRTLRCTRILTKLAFEMGGQATSRVTRHLQLTVSGDTVLRLIRATHCPLTLHHQCWG
jgi:transposase